MSEQNSINNNINDIAKLDNRQRGQLAELAFMRKAASLGFSVSKPWQEAERYDVVVRVGSIFWRVQVKSVLAPQHSSSSYCVRTVGGNANRRTHYSGAEIDFLVAYIFAADIWYVFPIAAIGTRKSVSVRPKSGKCRFLEYREAWNLLKANSAEAQPPLAMSQGAS
jgi:PD-(D/E)XK endonuclease